MATQPIGYIVLDEAHEPYDSKVISTHNGKPVAEGILQDVDAKNRNGRRYSGDDLFPEIKAPRQIELIKTGNMKGENGHPQDKDLSRQQTIDPDKVCVKYLDIWQDGKYVKGRYTGTNNDRGRDFDADLLCGEKPSFSLRALGTIENVRGEAWVRNLKVITWDRVIYPSHACAYTEKLVSESGIVVATPTFESVDMSKVSDNRREILEGSKGDAIPFDSTGVINFIVEESGNLAIAMKTFDVFYESMEITRTPSGQPAVQMRDKFGSTIVIPLEKYVSNQIMDHVWNNMV